MDKQLNIRLDSEFVKTLKEEYKKFKKTQNLKLSFNQYVEHVMKTSVQKETTLVSPSSILQQSYQDNPFWHLLHKQQLLDAPKEEESNFSHSFTLRPHPQSTKRQLKEILMDFHYHASSVAVVEPCHDTYKTRELNVTATTHGHEIEKQLFGNGTGILGTVSNYDMDFVYLTNTNDANNFYTGMELDVVRNGKLQAYGISAHGLIIQSIDCKNGLMTFCSPENDCLRVAPNDVRDGIPSLMDGDQLVKRGSYNNQFLGVESWIPYGGPTSDLFGGVNRTVDATRLAGNWLDATQMGISEALIKASSMVGQQGGRISHFFVSHDDLAQLVGGQHATQRINLSADDVTHDVMKIYITTGEAVVIASNTVPHNRIFGLDMTTWTFCHREDLIRFDDWQCSLDGNQVATLSTNGNLICSRPASNITIARI